MGKKARAVQEGTCPASSPTACSTPLWREAISIVEHGIADAATVDEAVRYSFGLRLPPAGPHGERRHGGHRPDPTTSHDYILKDLEDSHEPLPPAQAAAGRGQDRLQDRRRASRSGRPNRWPQSNAELNEYLIRMLYGK